MPDLGSTLDAYARAASDRLAPQTHCSILLRHERVLRHVASSDERAGRCDQVEVRTGEGPCVVAIEQLSGLLVPDLRAESRWAAWREAALDAGFLSSAALPAVADDTCVVALNLYADTVDPWDRDALLAMDSYVQDIAEAVRTDLVR